MTRFAGSFSFGSLALAVVLCAVGCHSNQDQPSTDATAQNQADQGQDPAAANLATASYNTTGAASASSSAPQPSSAPQSASPDNGSDYSESADDSTYAEPPVATAPQPPPALPDYQQPPCPGDGYIWTPGYWNYASTGYYWVPGVWTRAPYTGALWTPEFWAIAKAATSNINETSRDRRKRGMASPKVGMVSRPPSEPRCCFPAQFV